MGQQLVTSGQQAVPLDEVADLQPSDVLEVAHAAMMCVSVENLEHGSRARDRSFGLRAVTPTSAGTDSLEEAAAGTASPSHGLLERLAPKQRASRVRKLLPLQLRTILFYLHCPDLTQ